MTFFVDFGVLPAVYRGLLGIIPVSVKAFCYHAEFAKPA